MIPEDKPFKNREDVKTDIRQCALVSTIITFASLIFAALGVISDAFEVTIVLESMSWFLLAIFVGLNAIIPNIRSLTAKHLYGIESELKSQ